ncbi:MAG: hypothetical protein A4S17_01350 [Proteobacteria bacterium HN_bin10]|nr:MAG: hypothetical protein A4S17_01350 [Proteobacteria bacterium HN_bin10]
MLTELRIANFALIERLTLTFTPGFQILTGETGAGKSILIDALALLVGGRASAEHIRADADEAELEAAFDLSGRGPAADRLREAGLIEPGEEQLIVRRVLARSGKNRVYLNGRLAAVAQLHTLAGAFLEIHGQHEQQALADPDRQLDVVDAFGRLQAERAAYGKRFTEWQGACREEAEAAKAAADRAAKEDLLRFQHQELSEAHLEAGEDERLESERRRLAHAEKLGQLSHEAYAALYEEEASVLGQLGSVMDRLKQLEQIDPDAADWVSSGAAASAQLRDLAQRVRDYRERIDHDPERLAQVEDRLERLHRLKKKYGGPSAGLDRVLARAAEVERALSLLDQGASQAATLRERVEETRRALDAAGARLTEARKKAAKKLEGRIVAELAALRMEQTRVQITVQPAADGEPGPTGMDRVEFRLSANPGEPLLPLAQVASGGELSRVMLAVKTVLADMDGVPVLIFDEVDAGIGGATAAVVGKRLKTLSRFHQVLCVTHLPQIASQADAHYLVEKSLVKKRTVTQVRRLDRAGREQEVARMLGGLAITDNVKQTAAEMLDDAGRDA